jgi:uncharacterized protein YcsI (UPF0317 family)
MYRRDSRGIIYFKNCGTFISLQNSRHGSPIHIGEPAMIGVSDMARPDFGDPVPLREGEIPVFWACGVTPQTAAIEAGIPFMITHSPGHMFITDLRVGVETG